MSLPKVREFTATRHPCMASAINGLLHSGGPVQNPPKVILKPSENHSKSSKNPWKSSKIHQFLAQIVLLPMLSACLSSNCDSIPLFPSHFCHPPLRPDELQQSGHSHHAGRLRWHVPERIGVAMDFPWCFNSIFVYCRDLGITCWNLTPTKSHKPFALSIVFHTIVWRRAGADCKSLKTSLAAATLPAWDGRMLLSENKFRCSSLIKWKTSTNSPWHLMCPRPSQKHSDHWGGAVAPWVRHQGHVAELLDAIQPPLEWIMNA